MSIKALAAVENAMQRAGVNYALDEWRGDPVYPYWIGEYAEFENLNEDGLQETSFILTGFTRGTRLELEQDKDKIRGLLMPAGIRAVSDESVIAVFYGNAIANIPTGDAELKKMQVNLTIKEWSVT